MPDLRLAAGEAMKDAPVANQPAADPAADGDVKDRIAAASRAKTRLTERRDVRVVFHEHWQLAAFPEP